MVHEHEERKVSLGRLFLLPMILMLLSFGCLPVMADDTPVKNDSSYYEISTAAQLKWFATKVNAGDLSINGVLTADIDLSSLGEEYWTPIGQWSEESATCKQYKGKFNGQGHTITGLVLRKAAASGLFGFTEGATISNVTVSGALMKVTPDTRVAAIQYGIAPICGVATGGTVIENCHSALTEILYKHYDAEKQKDIDCVGGIVGELRSSTAKDCTVNGFVRTDGRYVGGIVGALNCGLVQNCHLQDYDNGNSAVVGIDYVGGIAGYLKNRTIENAIIDCTVAYKSVINATAGQDALVCGYGKVFAEPDQFDGFYEIYNADQLKWFSSQVNSGNTNINGKLMNDLNMSKAGSLTPIGTTDHPFAGEFDGQRYTIDSLTIASKEYAGLFGYVKDGRVLNVTLTHPYLTTTDNDYQGLIVGWLTQNPGHSTPVGYIENCHVRDGQLIRNGSGEPQYVGGIVGKVDMSAEVRSCSFQGIVKAHEDYIGGIAGCMDSGAKMNDCTTIGPSAVWGDDYVGGVVGYMTDTDTKIDNCFADQSEGQITVHAEGSGYSGLIRGYDNSGSTSNSLYSEGNLNYKVTGKKLTIDGNQVSETHITGVNTKGKGTYYAIVDIGTSSDYFTTEIENLSGVETLYFWDNCSNIVGTNACGWINMTIADYAFDSDFKALKMYYHMFADDDHDVMLRPSDVRPAGEKMFANCPDAKIYVDAEYYDEFCNDSLWGKYKDYIVPTTSMRTEDVNAEYGARYAYDRSSDKYGSIVKNGKVSQVHVIGADDSYINDSDNENTLWIYQDIGQTYDYNTTKIWTSSFKGKDNIKQVKFQEITKSADRASQAFKIEIGDSAFANCKNLAAFNAALYSDDEKYHVEFLYPHNLPIGKNVFAGSDQVKVKVPRDLVDAFKNDTTYGWSQYKDIIEAGDFGATDYTERGVIYSYYTSADGMTRYNSGNNTEMEALLASHSAYLRNFSPIKVLVYDQGDKVVYMLASGVDPSKINDKKGEMCLYNDIAETYPNHYKTLALSGSGFQNQTCIEKITFEDIKSNNYNIIADFSLIIPDGTFKGCSNLKELNMFMYVTKGYNHYEGIKPSQVFIGEHVFDGVSKDFRINVLPEYYNDFITDPNWSQYKDYIVACYYLPNEETSINPREGVTYEYASSVMNGLSVNQIVTMKSSWWNVAIKVLEAIPLYFSGTVLMAPFTAMGAVGEAIISNVFYFIYYPFTFLSEEALQFWLSGTTMMLYLYLGAADVAIMVEANKSDNDAPINYIANRVKKYYEHPASSKMHGTWLLTEDVTNVPRVYIKKVDDQETVTIYNDPGEDNSDYQTVAIARDAFHNKTKLKTVKFQERYGSGSRSLAKGMTLALPDSMFYGCKNLETFDLINYSTGAHNANHAYKGLTPDNFLPMGDIFAGLDSAARAKIKIRVGKEELQEFLDDEYWSQYKDMYKAEDVDIVRHSTEWSCKYALAYDKNTLPLRHTVDNHDIDHVMIYGPDNTELDDDNNEGLAALINDMGNYNNYKLDYVKAGAFKGNDRLKILDIGDSHTNIAKVYCAFDVVLQDSAFAHCKNFRDLNLIYQVTVGDNHTESMSPRQFLLGNGVFDDTPNLRIKFCLDQEDAFLADTSWVKYKDKFAPCFFEPLDEEVGDILLHPYRFLTKFNDGTNFEHVDATRAKPEDLKNLFKGKDIESFDEFRAFGTCGLRTIYNGMFSGCSSLQTIMLPDSTTSIETDAFKNCSLLYNLTIPAKVTEIQENAFTGSGITRFTMKSSVPAPIDAAKAFNGLDDSYIIYVPDTVVEKYKTAWSAVSDHINGISQRRGLKVVTLTEAGTLAEKLGLRYEYTKNPFLDNHLKGNYAQYDSLRIIGPIDGRDIGVIRYMGGRDVEDCQPTIGHLKYLDLYEANIRSAGSYDYNRASYEDWAGDAYINDKIAKDNQVSFAMFYGLDKLETLILPKTATEICRHAMRGCTNLKYLVIGDDVSEIADHVAGETNNKVALVMLSNKVPKIPYNAFIQKEEAGHWQLDFVYTPLTTEEEHFNVLFVPEGTMSDYTSKAGLTAVADSVMTNFKDPALVEALKDVHVFSIIDLMSVSNITDWMNNNNDIVTFNELYYSKVSKLGANSLSNMRGLQEVTLPVLLQKITKDAFKGCSSLRTINAFGLYVPELEEDALNDLPKDFVVYVPEGVEDLYRKAWPQYKNHIQGYRTARVDIREVTLTEPNTLADSLNAKITMNKQKVVAVSGIKLGDIQGLKVNGPIGGKDLALIRYLGGREPDWADPVYTTNLKYLDLYDAELKADGISFQLKGYNREIEDDNEVPKDMLWKCDNLETVIMPRTATKICYEACYDMASLKKLVIGDNTTYIDDDALGACRKLEDIIFLCKSKPTLDGDAFTDKVGNANYKVQRMMVRHGLVNAYSTDDEFTDHANEINTSFDDINQFRAFGCKAIVNEDDLPSITNVKGWFKNFPELTKLDVLGKTHITSLDSDDVKNLVNLQQVSLPSTLTTLEEGTFKTNTNLHWVDLSACDSLKTDVLALGVREDALLYAPSTAAVSNHRNVVYGKDGSLSCYEYYLSDQFDNDVPKAFTANKVTFGRSFTPNSYATLTLPFSVSHTPTGFKVYAIDTDSTKNGMLYFRRAKTMEANVPYVVKTKADVTTMEVDGKDAGVSIPVTPIRSTSVRTNGYTMMGNLQTIAGSDAKEQKLMVMNDTTKLWNPVTTDTISLKPYTVYVVVNTSSVQSTDVPSKFEDYLYHYYIGNTTYDIEGDGTVDDPLVADDLTLVDGLDFRSDKPFLAKTATYARTMTNTWGTLCLPYAIDASVDNATCYFYTVADNNGDHLSLTRQRTMIPAGTPILVQRRQAGTDVVISVENQDVVTEPLEDETGQMAGSFQEMEITNDAAYIIANDHFWNVGNLKTNQGANAVKIKGFRSYLLSGSGESKLNINVEDDTTIVDRLNSLTDDADTQYYDVQGRQTNGLQNGLNIVRKGNQTTKILIK